VAVLALQYYSQGNVVRHCDFEGDAVLDRRNARYSVIAEGLLNMAHADRLDRSGIARTIRSYAGPDAFFSHKEEGNVYTAIISASHRTVFQGRC